MLSANPKFASRRFRLVNSDFSEMIQDGMTWNELETKLAFDCDSPISRQLYMMKKNTVVTVGNVNVIRTK